MKTIAGAGQAIDWDEPQWHIGTHDEKAPAEAPAPVVPPPDKTSVKSKHGKSGKGEGRRKGRGGRETRKRKGKKRSAPRVPGKKAWCRALTSPGGEHEKQKRWVLRWLKARLASTRSKTRKIGPPLASAASRQAKRVEPEVGPMSREDERSWRAAGPTRKRLLKLAGRTSPPVGKLLEIIAERFWKSDCQVYLVSRQAAATGWHLKQFRRELGITPGRLIQECQREMSSVLLRDTSLLVETVARQVGFKSASAQRRIYRDLAGISPSKMRDFLHLIAPEQQSVGEEVRGWYFWVRLHRGELDADDYRAAINYLKNCSSRG